MSISSAIRDWAAANRRLAQGLIVLAAVLLFYLSHLLGVLVDMLGYDPYAMLLIGVGLSLLAWVLAPRRGDTFPIRYTYARQKVSVILMLTNMCIGLGGSAVCLERFVEPEEDPRCETVIQTHHAEAAFVPMIFAEKKAGKWFDKGLSAWFRGGLSTRVTKRFRKALKTHVPREISTLGRIMGTLGVLMLVWLLVSLVAFLSCSLSCNGNITLSYVVLIGGLGLVVLLAIRSLKWIHRKKKVYPLPDS